MQTITLTEPWTYRTPLKTIDYASGQHEVSDTIARAFADAQIPEPVEPSPLDGSVPDLTAYLATIIDPAQIEALIAAERIGKTRSTALAALESRKAELTG